MKDCLLPVKMASLKPPPGIYHVRATAKYLGNGEWIVDDPSLQSVHHEILVKAGVVERKTSPAFPTIAFVLIALFFFVGFYAGSRRGKL